MISSSSAAQRKAACCPAARPASRRLCITRFQPNEAQHAEVNARKQLKGPCVVSLVGKRSHPMPVVPAHPEASLSRYMSMAAERFGGLELPLGGRLTRLDAVTMALVVPKIELFDIVLAPVARCKVVAFPAGPGRPRAEISSGTGDCVLHGSHHVEQLKLNDRFNLDVLITFTWTEPGAAKPLIYSDAHIEVEVDVPPPFSVMPKMVIKAAGDASMGAVLAVMMPLFMQKLGQDYAVWASSANLE